MLPKVVFRQGFTLLEGILALSILLSLLVLGSYYSQKQLEENFHRLASEHLILVSQAATRYVLDNYAKIQSNEELSNWQMAQKDLSDKKETLLSLEAWRYQQMGNYLDAYGISEKNVFQQSYEIYIEDISPLGMQLIIISSAGATIKPTMLQAIARRVGNQCGYIIQKKDSGQSSTAYICGRQHSWERKAPIRTFFELPNDQKDTGVATVEGGHLAFIKTINPDDTLNADNFLHRIAVPSKPKLNQMETNLYMQEHQIIFKNYNKKCKGILNAEKLTIENSGQKLLFGFKSNSEKAEIELHDRYEKEWISITAERVSAQRHIVFEEDIVIAYSPPELHSYWNKIPYYELKIKKETDISEFAKFMCAKYCQLDKSNSQNNSTTAIYPLGKLFLIGRNDTRETSLFLCGYPIMDGDNKITHKPHLIKSFPDN